MDNRAPEPTHLPRARRPGWSLPVDPQLIGLLIALAILVIFFGLRIPSEFFRSGNLISIGEGSILIGLTALAEAVVLLLGGLDISIGSAVGMCSAAAGVIMLQVDNPWAGIVAALGVGLAGGLANGLIITKGKLDPVVVTLGTYTAYRGVALLISPGGYAVNVRNAAFNSLGTIAVGGLPVSMLVLIVVIAIFYFFLGHTTIGRNIYAIGGSAVEARLAGIRIDRYKLGVYALSGLMAGLAAIMLTSRTKSGQPISGSEGLELQAITAAILGGVASSKGGKGSVIGVILGVLIIGTLNNGMILLSVPTFYQRVARGLLLIVAALIQYWQMRSTSLFRANRKAAETVSPQ